VVAGAAASLTVVPTAITIAGTIQTVQWFKGFSTAVGVAIPGATAATLSIASASPADANYYYAVVTNSLAGANPGTATSSVTSSIVRLGVNTAPAIVTQPAAAPIATEGTSFTLTVVATDGSAEALAYQWQKDGVAIAGANVASYTLASPAAADAGSYTCVITSSLLGTPAQTVTTAPSNLVVNLKPVNLTPVVSGDTVNGPITLTVTPTNLNTGSTLTYAWKRNSAPIPGAVLPTFTINELTSASAGNYTCDVSSVFVATATSNGSTATATSPSVAVGVGSGITAPVVIMGSSYTAGKTGITVTTASQAGATYAWSVTNGLITAGAGTNTITVTAGSKTTVPMTATVVVSNATGGAVGTASATLVAAATPAMVLAPASVHPGDTWMKASIDNQGGTYSWNVTGAGSITGSASSTGLSLPFSVNSSAANGDSITLTANVQNAAGDAAPTATKTVSVTTGTWINKDGGTNWNLGAGINTTGSAAAVFANGRVLVCGGQTVSGYTPATAAIYDPAIQRWTRVAEMNYGRTGHTATALPNGTILVTGGTSVINGVATWLNNAEIYDPATNTWILVTSTTMGTGRVGHAATLLTAGASAGKVVITGGKFSINSDNSGIIAVFQPTGSAGNFPGGFFTTSPVGLNLPRSGHTATALKDGRVLIAGGQGATNETYQQAEIFDATAAMNTSWSCTKVGSLTVQPRFNHTATLLLDGRVFIAGGSPSGSGYTAELFDPAAGTFTATAGTLLGGYLATNPAGRFQHAATRLADGRVLLTGGQGGTSQGVGQSAEVYDPATGLFTSVTPMNSGRWLHNSVALTNGTVMVLGGSTPNANTTASTEIFDPAANGGAGGWTTIGAPGRSLATVTLLPDGRVMLVGGQNERQGNDPTTTPATSQSVSRTTHLYDPATGTWTDGPPLATARYSHSTVLLTNGKLLVAGGVGPQNIGGRTSLASAEIYDPVANAWTPAGSMNVPRVNFGMITLPNGKVLAIGGSSNSNNTPLLATTEIYDPDANTWAYTSNGTAQTTLSEQKFHLSPILLSTGEVVVAGGSTGGGTSSSAVEVFDPASQNWSPLTPLATARTQHFPVALPDGKFVLLGGHVPNSLLGGLAAAGAPGGVPGALEIYDTLANGGQGATVPTANAFFKTEGRVNAGAAVLPSGKVLLAAGSLDSTTGASTSEIYDPATDTLTVGPALTTGQGAGVLGVSLANGDVMLIGGSQTDAITQVYRP
jgi:hypothetical protein